MEMFFQIINGWSAFGQGLFFLLVLGGLFTLIQRIFYYISVSIQGWPPEHVTQPGEEDEDDVL